MRHKREGDMSLLVEHLQTDYRDEKTPLVYTLNGVGTSYHRLSYRISQCGHVTPWSRQRQASLKNRLLRTVKNDAILKETCVCCGKV